MRNSFHENIVNVAMFVCEITLANGIQGEKTLAVGRSK